MFKEESSFYNKIGSSTEMWGTPDKTLCGKER